MSDCQTCLWHQTLHQRRNRLNGLNAIVYKEDLTSSGKLEVKCRLNHVVGKLDHLSLNREPIAWRSFNKRHIAETTERHIEGARDWRSGKSQNIYAFFQLLQSL